MPVNTRELIEVISMIANSQNLRVTIKSSLKASCTTALSTFFGGLLFGPMGVPIGATVGGLVAYAKTKERFKSVAEIIRNEFTTEQKQKLCQHLINAFKEIRPDEIAMLIPLITKPGQMQSVAIKKIIQFFVEEMNMEVVM